MRPQQISLPFDIPMPENGFRRDAPYNALPPLPPKAKIETLRTLKKAIGANRALAELRGVGNQIPNQAVLIRSILLQEAKLSSEIENVVTTNDRLYRALSDEVHETDSHTKEVLRYEHALWKGYQHLKSGGLLNTRHFIELVQTIKQIEYGVRNLPGTRIVNPRTSEAVYTPPEGERVIRDLLDNLSDYIYAQDDIDPLIKLAALHYQFEAIHPFSDGNGRTGRILNILYLVEKGLLDIPVLYLSRYIIENKSAYYTGLRRVTEEGAWEDWIVYMLEAVEATAVSARERIVSIREALLESAEIARTGMSRGYSKELIELIYQRPYTRIAFLESEGVAKRQAASVYLKNLAELGVLQSVKHGREILYLNPRLLEILSK